MKKRLRFGVIITIAGLWVIFAALYSFNAFDRIEKYIYDNLYQNVQPVDSRIVIIGIDAFSIREIGRWPWQRDVMAGMIDILHEGGAKVIGIDVIYDSFSGYPEEDAALATAIERAGNVVLGVEGFFRRPRTTRGSQGEIRADDLFTPVFEGAHLAFINALVEEDSVVRRAFVDLHYEEEIYKSFAYVITELYGETPEIPTDSAGRFLINYTGRAGWYYPLSFADVYFGRVPPSYFKDKIVLIGLYAQGVAKDWAFTAMDRQSPTYGVEIHANIIQQLLNNNYFREWQKHTGFLVFALYTLPAAAMFVWRRRGMPVLVTALALYGAFAYIVIRLDIVLNFSYTPLFILSAYITSMAWHYAQNRLNEARVRNTFGKYMAPSVIKKILEEGENGLQLGGKRCSVTVLFVDMRGFTPLSEAAPPEEIVNILNEYLDLAASCIHRHGGTLDKFMGDAAMAFWGAPYEMAGHAEAAVRAAVDMLRQSSEMERKLEEKYGRTVRFGVGINSGEAVIGNIGSHFRMDYTAIGDAVNTSARLESNAKPGQVLISRAAAERLPEGMFELVSLGGISVKGKVDLVEIFEIKY